uniref:Homeobox domain-containing protein n=1 Tax=Heterorhabditis bacteriophora TaxID=37862 RepID=A0A1I7WYJ9_HETBA
MLMNLIPRDILHAQVAADFSVSKNIRQVEREQLAFAIGLTAEQVKVWFQNQRYKSRQREKKKFASAITHPISIEDNDPNNKSYDIDRSYNSEQYFLQDNEKIEEIRQQYTKGDVLTGGLNEDVTQLELCKSESKENVKRSTTVGPFEYIF